MELASEANLTRADPLPVARGASGKSTRRIPTTPAEAKLALDRGLPS